MQDEDERSVEVERERGGEEIAPVRVAPDELMPDTLQWLGIRKIHRLVSMSNVKYDAITRSGIEVEERVSLPEELVPADARVEIEAKLAAGYFSAGEVPGADKLASTKGRGLGD